MLTKETMGLAALAILWINALLVAAAALKTMAARWRERGFHRGLGAGASGIGAARGRIVSGEGPGSALAIYRVAQIGRAGDPIAGKRAIHWSDKGFEAEVHGGVVALDDGRDVRVRGRSETASGSKGGAPASHEGARVWPARSAVAARAACADRGAFDAVYEQARKAKGSVRHVDVPLVPGDVVWVSGEVSSEKQAWNAAAPPSGTLTIAAMDPAAWCARAALVALGFALAEIAVAAALTRVTLIPPYFSGWSTLGGVACLAFFLLVQPAGVWISDRVRVPGEAFVRGTWIEP